MPPAEVPEVELYHPKTFIGKYIWSQDAKVIAVQYGIPRSRSAWWRSCCRASCAATRVPHAFSFIIKQLSPVRHHARMIMVITADRALSAASAIT
jgi:hypothetical protein